MKNFTNIEMHNERSRTMKTTMRQGYGRVLVTLAAAAAVIGGMLVTVAATGDADAALKWREEASVDKTHDNNKDGLKQVEPTPVP